MLTLLKQAEASGAIRALDYHFAAFIAPQGAMALAAALLSVESHAGHVCLPLLKLLEPTTWFEGRFPQLAHALWQKAQQPSVATWHSVLQQCDAVGEGDGRYATPIVLDQHALYLQRLWHDEVRVAAFLRQTQLPVTIDTLQLQRTLDQLFTTDQRATIDWQKVAIAVAATRKTALILGGPGTGKTTTVARLLATLLLLSNPASVNTSTPSTPCQRLRIQLAAPTGKAAVRLTQSLLMAIQQLPLTAEITAQIPTTATTLHRLLGAQPDRQQWHYHAEHQLPLDLLIVDEASLIDLPLMARLVAALPQEARLILLGDSDQLAAVEAGAVLDDLAQPSKQGYSAARAAELTALTGYPLVAAASRPTHMLADSTCYLRTRHRFQADSVIDQLAQLIKGGNEQALLDYLQQAQQPPAQRLLTWYPTDPSHYQSVIHTCVDGYRDYLQRIQRRESAEQIVAAFNRFQLLCALREGPFGVEGLNQCIEQALQRAHLITLDPASGWYSGRPIVITHNHYALELFNGDIGITLPDPHGCLRVYFAGPDGVKAILPSRLPACHTTYALTVHKSQGSEFDHTLLLLPANWSPLLTRQLLYTAVTRARKQLTLCADVAILRATLNHLDWRHSRLAERLNSSIVDD